MKNVWWHLFKIRVALWIGRNSYLMIKQLVLCKCLVNWIDSMVALQGVMILQICFSLHIKGNLLQAWSSWFVGIYQWYSMKNVALSWTCLTLSCFCASSSLFLCQAYLPFRPTCCSVSAASSTGPFLISTECYLNLSYSTSHHTMNYNYLCMYFISPSRIGPLMLRVMPASSYILCLAQSPEWAGTQEIFC